MGGEGFGRLQLLVWGIFVSAVMFGLGFLTGSRWTEKRVAESGRPFATHPIPLPSLIGPSEREIAEIPKDEVPQKVWPILQGRESEGESKGSASGPVTETPARPEEPPKSSPPVVERAQTMYVVQVVSVRDRRRAEAYAGELAEKGYPTPRVTRAELPKRGTWYRVRLGPFAGEEEARRWAKRIREEEDQEPRVMREGR